MIETYSAANKPRPARQWSRAVPQTRVKERRRWPRLPLAIPVFMRGSDEWGKDILEFSTIVNISAGGVSILTRKRPYRRVRLEIPVGSAGLDKIAHPQRKFEARILRVVESQGWYWCAAKFNGPIRSPSGESRD